MADNDFGLDAGVEAARMAANGIELSDYAESVIQDFLQPDRPFRLTVSTLLEFHHLAVQNLRRDAGRFRTGDVILNKRAHQPPKAFLVENLVRELCDYVNNNWHERTAFHLSAYVMWRLNWVHPFSDGNGRTSRTASYLVLCAHLRHMLPGRPTIPVQIEANRQPYFDALQDADANAGDPQSPQIGKMEDLIKDMLAHQLLSVVAAADGADVSALIGTQEKN